MKHILIFCLISFHSALLFSQSLLESLDSIQPTTEPIYITNSFKSVRLINGYTSDIAGKNDLIFSISHRFGKVNQGIYDLFGLDQSVIRFGFEYGLNDRISLGIGRSNFEKLYDGYFKIKLINQQSDGFPLSISLLEGSAVKTQRWIDESREYPFSSRLYYIHELFISRKFSRTFSAQISPVIVHRNMVSTAEEQNLVSAIGFGCNYSINNWLSISGEYYALIPGYTADNYSNSAAFGVEIESGGGHIFQIHVSNSDGMTEKAFIPETASKWSKGEVGIGFNLIRVFHLKNNK